MTGKTQRDIVNHPTIRKLHLEPLAERDLSRYRMPDGIPVVPNLDRKILNRIEQGRGKLDMSSYHACSTTHCRAGWAIVLAGKAGRDLERDLNDAYLAGALIYWKSAGYIPDFFASNEEAMVDMRAHVKT